MATEPVTYSICAGEPARDYAVGDFLNAINEVICLFQHHRAVRDDEIKQALQMYVNTMGD